MRSFSFYWTDELGAALKKEALRQCPEGFNLSTMCDKEYRTLAAAVNQGIDSYLEALQPKVALVEQKAGEYRLGTRAYFCFPPEQVHTLVRRLMEIPSFEDEDLERENSAAEQLASSICNVLGIELV